MQIHIKPEDLPRRRNPVAMALHARHGKGAKIMKDRRIPRRGARNKQRDYREENY